MRGSRKVFWAGILVIALAIGAVGAAEAQNLKRSQQARPAAGLRGTFLQGLDLTDQQKQQIRTILATHKADIQSVAQANLTARKDLREALAAGADTSTLKAAYDRLSAAKWDALVLRKSIGEEL